MGLACGAPPSEELQTAGGVKLFAVASEMRRQGIATRLFDHIEDRLTGLGATESLAIIAGNNRFMQGLDLRYTEALCFLEARGYERAGDGMDMDVDLRNTPLDTSAKEEELERVHGLRVRRVTMEDYGQAWEYVAREFEYPSALATTPIGRRWAYLATSGLKLDPPTLWMAERDGEFCGFAVTDVAAPERLGPMGVSPEVRKLGVGTILLKRALADLRDRGVDIGVIYGAGPVRLLRPHRERNHQRRVLAPAQAVGRRHGLRRSCRNVSRETLGASRPVLGSLARVAGRDICI